MSTVGKLAFFAVLLVLVVAGTAAGCATPPRTLSAAKTANYAVAQALSAESARELAMLRASFARRAAACTPLLDPSAVNACLDDAQEQAVAERAAERAALQKAILTQRGFNWLLSTYDGCEAGATVTGAQTSKRCDEQAILDALPELVRLLGRYAPPPASSAMPLPSASAVHS